MSRTWLYQWAKTNKVMLFNTVSLIGTTVVTSGLGFVYWWLAAREFSLEAVGLASASISAMTLLGTFSVLGLGTLLIGELPRQRGKEASLISAALILVGGVAGGTGIVFAIIAPYLAHDFHVLGANIASIALFALGVSLTAITIVLDQALIGLLQGDLQLWRNTLFSSLKLLALFLVGLWLSRTMGLSIYATWVFGNAGSLVILAGVTLLRRKWSGRIRLPQKVLLRQLGLEAIKHHLLNLTLQAPDLILPILVTVLLSATTNAWFYVSWNIGGIANIITVAITTVLYATSAAHPALLPRKLRLTLSLAFLATTLANCVLLLGTKPILAIFGSTYAEHSAWSLRILSIEAFPFIIKSHYVAIRRIQGQVARAALPTIASAALELGASALGALLGGLVGLSVGWFIAMCIEAAFMSPTVYNALWPLNTSIHIDQLQQHSQYQDNNKIDMHVNEPSFKQ